MHDPRVMLALTSARWTELSQAYGDATDVPRLLEALAELDDEDARAEVWFALWRLLHRPDEAYSASYAAVPHLLRIAAAFAVAERAQAFHLVSRIEIARRSAGSASMPEDLVTAYAAAVEELPRQVADAAKEPWADDVARICAAALLVGKRQPEVARTLLDAGAGPAERPRGPV